MSTTAALAALAFPDWTVHVELELEQAVDEETAEGIANAIVNELGRQDAAAAALGDRVSAHVSCAAEDTGTAQDAAAAARSAAGDVWAVVARHADVKRVVAVEVVADDEMDRRLAEATIPPLASASDAAEILGVSRQRVHQLLDRPGFPQPVARTGAGPLWLRASIESFDKTWTRKPGRPAAAR